MTHVVDELWWDDEDAEHIRTRSSRYPGANDIEPAWTVEAAEAEAAENADTLDVPLHLRITRGLDAELRQRAAAEQISTSALVRRLLTKAVHDYRAGGLTEEEVEEIARRVVVEQTDR